MYPFIFDNLGVIFDYQNKIKWSSLEFKQEILKRVYYFSRLGINSGDKVVLIHGNNAKFFADLFALWYLDVCAVVVDPDIGSTEFKNITKFCKARFAIYCNYVPEKINIFTWRSIKFVNSSDATLIKSFPSNKVIAPSSVNIDNPALILFTSGTTGKPKGVVHTFRTLLAKLLILPQYVPLHYLEASLCLLPTHFGHGLICNCLFPLLNKRDLVILPKFNLNLLMRLGKIIDEFSITHLSSVPLVWQSVLNFSGCPKKRSLRLITCGSAPLSANLWNGIQEWSGINRVWNTYGITEVGSWIAGYNNEIVKPKSGLIGVGWGTNIAITKEREIADISTNCIKHPNEIGHIWLQTPMLMQGYLYQSDLTQEVISGSWFYTGDLGYLTKDGLLILSGRVRDEINYGGMKVMPEDVDFILARHKAIAESCVFGFDDEKIGQIVAAAIVFNKGIKKPSSEELKQWVSKYISNYKVPTLYFEVGEIPRTSNGKINRSEVAAFCKKRIAKSY